MDKVYYVKYRPGYKYKTSRPLKYKTRIIGYDIKTPFLHLYENGWLCIAKSYAWNGASGLTFDTPSSMRPSLIHDIFYQLMRLKLLPVSYRDTIDLEFYDNLLEDGMYEWRAAGWYEAVSKFALNYAKPVKEKEYIAP